MKVDFTSNLSLYRKSRSTGVKGEGKTASETAKTDVAEFARGNSATLDKALIGAKASIQSEIYAPAGAARIAQLKQDVKDGTYHLPTEDIVDALLDN